MWIWVTGAGGAYWAARGAVSQRRGHRRGAGGTGPPGAHPLRRRLAGLLLRGLVRGVLPKGQRPCILRGLARAAGWGGASLIEHDSPVDSPHDSPRHCTAFRGEPKPVEWKTRQVLPSICGTALSDLLNGVALVCLATGNPLPASCGGIDYTHLGTVPSECPDAARSAIMQVGRMHSDDRSMRLAYLLTYPETTRAPQCARCSLRCCLRHQVFSLTPVASTQYAACTLPPATCPRCVPSLVDISISSHAVNSPSAAAYTLSRSTYRQVDTTVLAGMTASCCGARPRP